MKILGTRLSRQEMRSVTGGICANQAAGCQATGGNPFDCGTLGFCCNNTKPCYHSPDGPAVCLGANTICYQIPD